ncbi:hypothetical protein F4553_001541 [Allocatelliglobosispora scoriae]|uniref:Uncharacterized protein n=1 Tax=Allocatelliglobosispora scoriae TaxID=643052 RepID=A0A841BN39_9ACTN|nr:hypothetical protein [Allocatelliglobosispora scoriae]
MNGREPHERVGGPARSVGAGAPIGLAVEPRRGRWARLHGDRYGCASMVTATVSAREVELAARGVK